MSIKTNKNKHYEIVIIDYLWDHHEEEGVPEIDMNAVTVCKSIKLDDEMVDHDLIKAWSKLKVKPLVIVFDLDLTLWPFWVDSHCDPPFKKRTCEENEGHHTIVDRKNKVFTFYTNVPKILNTLRNHCLKDTGYMAVASRTTASNQAMQLLEIYGWKDHFNSYQMYESKKTKHMNELGKELNVKDHRDVLFFDDDKRNIVDTAQMGVTGYLLDYRVGLTLQDCVKGLLQNESKQNSLE